MGEIHWELDDAQNGMPIVKILKENRTWYLHSRYDPEKEAFRWVERQTADLTKIPERFLVIGMGAGYHVHMLHRRFPEVCIDVWDFNCRFGEWLSQSGLLSWLTDKSSLITYRYTESLEEFNRHLGQIMQEDEIYMLIHSPSLELIPSALSQWKLALEEQLLHTRAYFVQRKKLDENFYQNVLLNDPGVATWINQYVDKPMIMVSGGPSLTKQIKVLKKAIENNGKTFVLGCVGTALIPLLNEGVLPDFVMISDASDSILEQFHGVNTTERPLFYLSTANHMTVKNYQGPRYIVWQKGYGPAEKIASERGEPIVETGGSVATCLLDLMVKMGGNPIALIGQDLAFSDGWSHASGTHARKRVKTDYANYEIDDFYRRGKVKTSLNLLSYLRWFERYVENKDPNRFWNCTEGGAYIKGWKHGKLSDFLDEFCR